MNRSVAKTIRLGTTHIETAELKKESEASLFGIRELAENKKRKGVRRVY